MFSEEQLREIIAKGTGVLDQVTYRGKQVVNHRLIVTDGVKLYETFYQVQEGTTVVFNVDGGLEFYEVTPEATPGVYERVPPSKEEFPPDASLSTP